MQTLFKGSSSNPGSGTNLDPNSDGIVINVDSLLQQLNEKIFQNKYKQKKWTIFNKTSIQTRVLELQTQLDKQKERFIGTFDDEFMKPYVLSLIVLRKLSKEDVFDICSQQIQKLFGDGYVSVSNNMEQDNINAITFLHSRHNRTHNLLTEKLSTVTYLHKFPIWMSYLLTLINGITYENPKPYAQRFFTFYYDDRNQIEPSFRRGDETETDKVENGERQTEMKTPEEKRRPK